MPKPLMIIGGVGLIALGISTDQPWLVAMGVGLVLSGVFSPTIPKNKASNVDTTSQAQTTNELSPMADRRLIFGDRAWGGSIAYIESHGEKLEKLTWILVLSDEPVGQIGEDYGTGEILDGIYVDGLPVRFIRNKRKAFPNGEFGDYDDWVPDPGDGQRDDWWWQTSPSTLWFKTSGAWKSMAAAAKSGSQHLSSGPDNPDASFGVQGEYYINTTTEIVWRKNVLTKSEAFKLQVVSSVLWQPVATLATTSTAKPSAPAAQYRVKWDNDEHQVLRIDFRRGEIGEQPFSLVPFLLPKWDANHRLDGCAKIAVTILAHPKAAPHGRPEILVRTPKGINTVLDPRTLRDYSVDPATDRITPVGGNPWQNGQKVMIVDGTAPGGLEAERRYYVCNRTATDFEVAYALNSAAVDITGPLVGTTRIGLCDSTENLALLAAHYLSSKGINNLAARYGLNCDTGHKIDIDSVITAANIADEMMDVTPDEIPVWRPSHQYRYGEQVDAGGEIYECISHFGDSASSGDGPSGNGSHQADGALVWRWKRTNGKEARWHGSGYIDSSEDPMDVLRDFALQLGGRIVHNGVAWKLHAGSPTNPSILSIGDTTTGGLPVALPIEVLPDADSNQRYNTVLTRYASAAKLWSMVDLDEISDPTSVAQDGGELYRITVTARFAASPQAARRAALVKLKELRRQERITFNTTLPAWELEQFDAFLFTHYPFGWLNRKLVVEEQDMAFRPPPESGSGRGQGLALARSEAFNGLSVNIVARDWDPAIYDESLATIAYRSDEVDLKDVLSVPPPEDLVVAQTPTAAYTITGSALVDLTVSWTPPADPMVASVEVQWALIDLFGTLIDSLWHAQQVRVALTSLIIPNRTAGDAYRIRARSLSRVPGLASDEDEDVSWYCETEVVVGYTQIANPPAVGYPNSGNMLSDPFLTSPYDSDGGDGQTLGGHVLVNADGAGDIVIESAKVIDGGYWPIKIGDTITTTRLRLIIMGGDTGDEQRVTMLEYLPVRPGQILQVGASIALETPGRMQVRVRFYDSSRLFLAERPAVDLISTQTGVGGFILGVAGQGALGVVGIFALGIPPLAWQHHYGPVNVPANAAFGRVFLVQILTTEQVPQAISLDGVFFSVVNRTARAYDPDEALVFGVGATPGWRYLVDMGAPGSQSTGLAGGFYSDGVSTFVRFDFGCDVRVKVAGSGATSDATSAEFQMVAYQATAEEWRPLTAYVAGDRVRNRTAFDQPQRTYQCASSGTSAASGGPSGAGAGIADGSAVWFWAADLGETSLSGSTPKSYGPNPSNVVGSASPWTRVAMSITASPAMLGEGYKNVRVEVRATPAADGGDPDKVNVEIRDISFAYEVLEAAV